MREHKYRAWDKHRKEYLSSGQVLLAILPGTRPDHNPIYLDVLKCADVYRERFVLEQFTGVVDKNGKEICEGDIVKAWDRGLCGVKEVRWRREGSPCYILYPAEKIGQWYLSAVDIDGAFVDKGVEVIGNINENPELLEATA